MICPLMNESGSDKPCEGDHCAWYCSGEECCSIKVLALEAIKRGE